MDTFGRTVIYTDQPVITRENVIAVLQKALMVHDKNREEIDFLYRYYKGDQPVRERMKEVRPEINNHIVENHAKEIVDFKTGYLMSDPVQYVSRVDGDGDGNADKVLMLNKYMVSEEVQEKNLNVFEWNHICGLGYKMVLPDSCYNEEDDEAPFEISVPDPRSTFVVYLNDTGKKPVMGVTYISKSNGDAVYFCYTKDRFFSITYSGEKKKYGSVEEELNPLGIPIVEYPHNQSRMGAFEAVIPLLDAINLTQSNRLDGIEQFIQAILVFRNVKVNSDDVGELRKLGAISYKDIDPNMPGEIKYLVEQLDQVQTQTLKDDMYEQVLVICGMPNRNGGSSTSDTGAAVEMRDGWSAASVQAKRSENLFKASEKRFLKKIISICKDIKDLSMKTSAIEIRFTRQNYENVMQKITVLTTMLGCDKIDPKLAFSVCGAFADPEMAYEMSMKWYKEEQKRKSEGEERMMNRSAEGNQNRAGNSEGSGGNPSERETR